ncbi:MAG: hypothetical protein HQL03_15750 [Nitrospirae bacterium]|nr:hypothetical protein [Nitrospirota bacterium]MBF0590687.1 hypothetical protein [Nitrospirota bacterium]
MSVIAIPKALRERLGDAATDDFIKVISDAGLDTRKDLATKEDVFMLKQDLLKVELNLKGDIAKVREDVAKVEIRLNENISKVREDVAKMSGEMVLLKWILGAVMAGIISLIVRAFFMH